MTVISGILCLLAFTHAIDTPPTPAVVHDFGAVGNGTTLDTHAIQHGIDTLAHQGGGTLLFPPGTYLTGSIHLRSHVHLELAPGAVIKGSPNDADYDPYELLTFENDSDKETSFFHFALLWGEDVEDIAIIGKGTIDGNRTKRGGPKPIALKRCKNVLIRDITIVNAPNYCISMLGTDDVNIDGIRIRNAFCDGIDPDSCKNVRIANCDIQSWDDAIVPKASFSLGERRATENIVVTNCLLSTACNAFKLGTESGGDFKRIAVSNCVVYAYPNNKLATSGIALESVDGSNIDGVTVSNISMIGVETPIFLRLGNRGRDMETPVPGTVRNITISNITAVDATRAALIMGIPNHAIENVTLTNLQLRFKGAGAIPLNIDVPEDEAGYPDADNYGVIPAFGLYARHASGLNLNNIDLSFDGKDSRPAVVFDDIQDVRLTQFRSTTASVPVMLFANVQQLLLSGCNPAPLNSFVTVLGDKSDHIALLGNDFSQVKKPVVFGNGARKNAVHVD